MPDPGAPDPAAALRAPGVEALVTPLDVSALAGPQSADPWAARFRALDGALCVTIIVTEVATKTAENRAKRP